MASTLAESSSSADSVTVWTSVAYLENDGTGKAKAEMRYYFESQIFYKVTASRMREYLQTCLTTAEEVPIPLIIIMCIEGNPIWLSSSLATGFPTIKSDWSKDFLNSDTFEPMGEHGTVVLPVSRKDARSLSFFMQYPVVHQQDPPPGLQGTDAADAKIKFYPVATWLGSSASSDPVNSGIPERCVSGNQSIVRLSKCPGHVFVDIFTMLSQWSEVWRSARRNVAIRDAQLHGEEGSTKVLIQTRALHRDTSNVIAMREEIRLHIAAFEQFITLLQAPDNRTIAELFGNEDETKELDENLEMCLRNLQHHQESSAVINRQLENLLSLVECPPNYA